MKTAGERIRRLREEKDWSQIELAKKANINNSVLSRIEASKRPIEDELLVKFAEIFNVTTDYLLCRTDYRNESSPEQKIKNAVSDDLELLPFWERLSQRPDLKMLFRQVKDMTPKEIKRIIRLIKAVEDEEAAEEF
ncbi:MAG: helix-turn-helix transcriptional regulator [Smithellaceae bacterium]|jgi:transcriptional regulator with XRE-family HTH domain|nr:helix-turn-helix transcriptional regulator [Smithellaceae bacterium]